ncbi:MAG: 2-phospho-L-lactate guanylyltransferase [Acetobacteraceae bacterium]|nr:2-phospho-L-lactate guanylyltransferase [Acetobacteraceae bacterium]
MSAGIWAVLPVKELAGAKQRLSPLLSPEERVALARVMFSEVMEAVAAARGLAGVLVVTLDPWAAEQARGIGARVVTEGARDGHTGSVNAGIRALLAERHFGMLAMPGDIPAATPAEIEAVLAAHDPREGRGFTIAPAHDEQGSNAVLLSPPDAVPLRFGDDSYFPHLDAARRAGLEPAIVPLPGIAMDIDHPADLAMFLALPQSRGTRTRAWLEASGIAARVRRLHRLPDFTPPVAGGASPPPLAGEG